MLKKYFVFGLVVFSLVAGNVAWDADAAALDCSKQEDAFKQDCKYGLDKTANDLGYKDNAVAGGDIVSIVSFIVKGFLSILALTFFILAMYAGIRWLTARESEELAERAKTTLENAVIGLVIVSASYAIATFVFGRLVTTGGGDSVASQYWSCECKNSSGSKTTFTDTKSGAKLSCENFCQGVDYILSP